MRYVKQAARSAAIFFVLNVIWFVMINRQPLATLIPYIFISLGFGVLITVFDFYWPTNGKDSNPKETER